jgi:molecular chaperone GrpE
MVENDDTGAADETNGPAEKEEASRGAEGGEQEKLKQEPEKLKNEMLYMQADFENYKKRVLKERSDLMKYGSEGLIRALLDLLDNFERAMSMEIKPENMKSFAEGVSMISTEFKNVLNRFGVSEVKALGQNFDPNIHEAMGTEPTPDYKAGTVSKVFTKPYKLHDRVVRPGRVIIAEEPKKTDE